MRVVIRSMESELSPSPPRFLLVLTTLLPSPAPTSSVSRESSEHSDSTGRILRRNRTKKEKIAQATPLAPLSPGSHCSSLWTVGISMERKQRLGPFAPQYASTAEKLHNVSCCSFSASLPHSPGQWVLWKRAKYPGVQVSWSVSTVLF